MSTTNIFIIILNYNGKEDTLHCLKSLSKLKKNVETLHCNVSTIVIDNASTNDPVKTVQRQFPKVQIHQNSTNTGFAQGNNIGIQLALKQGADLVLLLNNDTEVKPDLILQLIKAVRKYPQAGIFSPKIYFAPGHEFHKNRYKKLDKGKVIWAAGGKIDWQNMYGVNIGVDEVDKEQFNIEKQIDTASGCCMLLTRDLLNKINGFDERYFMYYEDVDLGLRAQKAGFEIWYVPKAKIWHKVAGSSDVGSELNDYYIARNRMLVGMKYAPWRTKYALIKESIRLLIKGRTWQKIGIRDFYLRKFGKGSYQDHGYK